MTTEPQRLSPEVLEAFVTAVLRNCDVDQQQAQSVARNIVWSELIGRPNFGVLRLPLYVLRLRAGGLNGRPLAKFQYRGDAVAILDGDGAFGQYAGELAMVEAIKLARKSGISVVGVTNSNFFGTGAYFVHIASSEGMIGLSMSNSFPKVVAHQGNLPVFGTNPFAFGTPRENGESILIDMATSALAGSTVRQYRDAGESLPDGFAIDREGRPINDPDQVESGALLPFGGAKGYCLALIVEILAGVITGAGVSRDVSSMYNDLSKSGQNGHCMIAIDIKRFMPLAAYHLRLESLIKQVKQSNKGGEQVLLPGEVRWKQYAENTRQGVPVTPETVEQVRLLAREVGVSCPV